MNLSYYDNTLAMKNSLLIIGLITLSACGNVTTSQSFTPAQRLKNTENELSKMGVTFDSNNALTSCESIYKATCENRVVLFKDFIIESSRFDGCWLDGFACWFSHFLFGMGLLLF